MNSPESLPEAWDHLLRAVPLLALAMAGAFVRWVRSGRCTMGGLAVGLVSAGFAGFLAFTVMDYYGVPPGLRGAIAGMVGYSAGDLLQVGLRRVCVLVGGPEERQVR